MNLETAKAKLKRIVEANTTYTQIHQMADPTPHINKDTLIEDLEMFIEQLLRSK